MDHPSRLNHWLFSLLAVSCILLSACNSLRSQPRPYTIGLITTSPLMPAVDAFKTTLAEQGYREGQSIAYLSTASMGNREELTPAIQGLLDARVDLLVVFSGQASIVAKELTAHTTLPVVFVGASDPVKDGLVTSLMQPGGNLTGVITAGSDGKRLEWLHQLDPKVKRVYYPYDPNNASPVATLRELQGVAPKLGIELEVQEVTTSDALDRVLDTIPQDIDAIVLGPDTLILSRAPTFCQLAIERRIPLTTRNVQSVKQDGALFTFGIDLTAVGRQAAQQADKVIRGTAPGLIPVETAEFFLTINLRTAESIGLTISDDYLEQAHEVVR